MAPALLSPPFTESPRVGIPDAFSSPTAHRTGVEPAYRLLPDSPYTGRRSPPLQVPKMRGNSRLLRFSETQEAVKARREVGRTTSTMMRAETTTVTSAPTKSKVVGAKAIPG